MSAVRKEKFPPLSVAQVRILRAIVAAGDSGLTRTQIQEETGCTLSGNLGSAYAEDASNNEGTLIGHKLVSGIQTLDDEDMRSTARFVATSKGKRASEFFMVRDRPDQSNRIPPKKLDPVVRSFKQQRTYSFEVYTDEDIQEIRSLLGEEWSHVPLASLREQMMNRRKVGAYADPDERNRRAVEAAIRQFGPEGTIYPVLTDEQVSEMRAFLTD